MSPVSRAPYSKEMSPKAQMIEWIGCGPPPKDVERFENNRNLFYVACSRPKVPAMGAGCQAADINAGVMQKYYGQARVPNQMKKERVSRYCIYKDAQSNDLSLEHVVPLSLGGHDSFSISADRSLNNGVVSKVDSAISNDFTILFDRRDLDATGHSGKPPEPKAKHSTFNNRKVQVTFGKNGLKVFDVRDRRDLEQHEFAVLDSAWMTRCDLSQRSHLDQWQSIDDTKHQIMWLIASQHRESCVMLIPSYDSFCVAVGVLGHFMGFISIPAPGHHLMNEGEYRLGHVITIRHGELLRRSFRQSMDDLQRDIESGNDSITTALDRMTARTGL